MKQNVNEIAEVRAEHVAQAARDIYAQQRAAVIAGDATATRELGNAVLDSLAEGGELAQLMRTSYSCAPDVIGREIERVLCDVARKQANETAEAQVAAAERAASEDPENCRPASRAAALTLDWLRSSSG